MKAYELMKLAKENQAKYQGKKYKVTNGIAIDSRGKEYKEVIISTHGELTASIFKMYVTDITEVEEIQQPIPFLEAVQAYAEGKTIRCTGAYREAIYKPNGEFKYGKTINPDMIDTGKVPLTLGEILHGAWFICEEGE
jgi:hypothetical protein